MSLIEVEDDRFTGNRDEGAGDRAEGSLHQLEFQPLDDCSWRLCDRTLAADHPSSVVAYVEKVPEGLTVVWLVGPRAPRTALSLEEVLAHAVERLSEPVSAGPRRPTHIPHRQPW
jgi:hypothetical protein